MHADKFFHINEISRWRSSYSQGNPSSPAPPAGAASAARPVAAQNASGERNLFASSLTQEMSIGISIPHYMLKEARNEMIDKPDGIHLIYS